MAIPRRERISDKIAYVIDWHMLGYPTVMRAGGTIHLIHKDGKEYRIVVEEVKR